MQTKATNNRKDAGGEDMRQKVMDEHRGSLTSEALQIDFHDFTSLSRWLNDAELADAFQVGRREVELLRRKMERN